VKNYLNPNKLKHYASESLIGSMYSTFTVKMSSAMFRFNYLKYLLILVLSLLMAGCASNQMYRKLYTVCNEDVNFKADTEGEAKCDQHSLQMHSKVTNSEYLLGFVEIDD
jgi:hypothetical protein